METRARSPAVMSTSHDERSLGVALQAAVSREIAGAGEIAQLRRLSGGASQETWSFEAATDDGPIPLILRRAPHQQASGPSISLDTEARLLQLAAAAGVPVAGARFVLEPEDDLGSGYVMERVEGETIPRKILRDDRYSEARQVMARQCGEILARIHSIDTSHLPELRSLPGRAHLTQYRTIFDSFDEPHPVFEVAFRWLQEHLPEEGDLRLVHGDFRNGNFIVGPDGIRAVLDWELAHLGNPIEDLGWICVNSWRFGHPERPVGGFGLRSDLLSGYEAACGGRVDPGEVRVWEIFGTLRWGIICMMQGFAHLRGLTRSVEKAAIGRRPSETEIDLMHLLTEAL
jgi:aminoglycoside phosphotransferase (APT) family kinase protein